MILGARLTVKKKIRNISLTHLIVLTVFCCLLQPKSEASLISTPDHGAEEVTEEAEAYDPLEEYNRSVFEFNRDVDRYVLHPLSEIYSAVLPDPARQSVHNVLSNLGSPLIFINDVLQLKGERAMDTLARTLINTTLGIGGLFDPASEIFGIDYHFEDFGQTLGNVGIGGDPYFMIPILGPSNPRDFVGKVVDFIVDPVNYALRVNHHKGWIYARTGVDAVDRRYEASSVIDRINAAHDPYVMMRSIYTQNREFNIKDGAVDVEGPVPEKE